MHEKILHFGFIKMSENKLYIQCISLSITIWSHFDFITAKDKAIFIFSNRSHLEGTAWLSDTKFWKGTPQGPSQLSFVQRRRYKYENIRLTPSDGKSWYGLWPGELIKCSKVVLDLNFNHKEVDHFLYLWASCIELGILESVK